MENITVEGANFNKAQVLKHKTLEAWTKWASERFYPKAKPERKKELLKSVWELAGGK